VRHGLLQIFHRGVELSFSDVEISVHDFHGIAYVFTWFII